MNNENNDLNVKKVNNEVNNNGVEPLFTVEETINMPSINGTNALKEEKKKKKSSIGILVIGIIILVIGSFLTYNFLFKNNPADILAKSINDTYLDLSSNLKKIETNMPKLDLLNEPIKIKGDLSLDGSLFKGIETSKLSYDLGLDYNNNFITASLNYLEDEENILNGNLYFLNNHAYLKSTTIDNNIYELGEYNLDEYLDKEQIESNLEEFKNISISDINDILKDFKESLIASLNKDNIKEEKGTLKFLDVNLNCKKLTMPINKETLEELVSTLKEKLLNNPNFINKLSKLLNQDEDDIKEFLESLTIGETQEERTLNIYVTNITNKFVGLEMENLDEKLALYNYDDCFYFYLDSIDNKWEIIKTKDNKITIKNNDQEVIGMVIRSFNEEKIDMDLSIKDEDVDALVNILIDSKKKSDQEFIGNIELGFKDNITENDFKIKFSYDLLIGEKLAKVNTEEAYKIEDLSEDKLENILKKLESTKLYDYLNSMSLLPGANNTGTDIYEDDDCFNDYMNQDVIDSYSDYYEQYC